MPILELPGPGRALNQGDILKDVTLFVTKASWASSGGETSRAPAKMLMVVSRPCVVAQKAHVVVAAVEKYPDKLPRDFLATKDKDNSGPTLDKVLKFLVGLRDGIAAPDQFYLGQLPNQSGRYCARLDSLHTIEIPTSDPAASQSLLAKRIACLHPDFARDLHARLFRSFASLGFDDYDWPSSVDLEWIVTQGEADVSQQSSALGQLQAQKAAAEAAGNQFQNQLLEQAQTKLEEIERALAPYLETRRKRQSPEEKK